MKREQGFSAKRGNQVFYLDLMQEFNANPTLK